MKLRCVERRADCAATNGQAIYPQYSVAVSGPHTLTRRTLIAAMALCRKLTFFRVALDSFLTYVLDFWLAEQPAHSLRRRVRTGSRSAIQQATVRAGLYWLVTLARYLLMLIAMGMDWVLLLILVTALACGQWVIELRKASSAGTELAHGTQSAEDDGAWEALYGTDGGDGSGMGPRKAPDEEHQTMYEHDEITLTEWPSGRTGRTEPKDDEARSLLGYVLPVCLPCLEGFLTEARWSFLTPQSHTSERCPDTRTYSLSHGFTIPSIH